MQRISDLALGVAIPVHSHMAMNSVITDYLPKGPLQGELPGMLTYCRAVCDSHAELSYAVCRCWQVGHLGSLRACSGGAHEAEPFGPWPHPHGQGALEKARASVDLGLSQAAM